MIIATIKKGAQPKKKQCFPSALSWLAGERRGPHADSGRTRNKKSERPRTRRNPHAAWLMHHHRSAIVLRSDAPHQRAVTATRRAQQEISHVFCSHVSCSHASKWRAGSTTTRSTACWLLVLPPARINSRPEVGSYYVFKVQSTSSYSTTYGTTVLLL